MQSEFETISLTREDNVALLRIDRGGSMNAISQKMIRELTAAVRELQDDGETKAVVITGTSKVFSAGIDLKDPEKWADTELDLAQRREIAYRGAKLCSEIEALPQITIAAISGPAIGAGVAITLACDWRIMHPDAYLWLPEIKIGLSLSWGGVPRLTALVGPSKAKRVLTLCEKLPADEAMNFGLADYVDSDPVALAMKQARQVAGMPPVPVAMSKEAVNAVANALHRSIGFADSDQGLLCRDSASASDARANFSRK